jgi:hypothetical protein
VARKITVIQMLPDMESGGVECVTLETAAYLVKHGHRSMVISAGGAMADQLQREGSHHLTWPHLGEKSPRCLTYSLPLATGQRSARLVFCIILAAFLNTVRMKLTSMVMGQ